MTARSTFADRVDAAATRLGHPLVMGIDPHLELLPPPFDAACDVRLDRAERADHVERFSKELIDLASGRVGVVKPQSAFYERLGADGVRAFENTCRHAREQGMLVIGDVKRGDVPSTAQAYAEAYLGGEDAPCDAITVNPYLGDDANQPFLEACASSGRGLFVLVRTSNPGSALFQEHGEPQLAERVAEAVDRWGSATLGACGYSSIGAVVGATHPSELSKLRERMPHALLLLPGVGAQGASAEDCRRAFPDGEHPFRGALVNSSRGIAFAWRKAKDPKRWKEAASAAIDETIARLRDALAPSKSSAVRRS